MTRWRDSETWPDWRAPALLGLISPTFSTVVSQLTAARTGQRGAIGVLHHLEDSPAVRSAAAALIARFGEHPSDREGGPGR